MRRIESYLLRQLLWPTLVATAALAGVALLSQLLTTLYIMVDNHQSVFVFIRILLLGLPSTLVIVLPVALFVATLVTLNRLHTEHEIVVCFAGGMSRWRVAAPALRLAAGAALITLMVNLWVQPWASRAMREELFRVRTDLAASLIREGEFSSPSSDLTVYAQSADGAGALKNVFIHQGHPDGGATAFSARRGLIAEQEGRPVLVLRDGSNQAFSRDGVLNYLAFDEYVFDLWPYLNTAEQIHFKISDRYLHELVSPDKRQEWERKNRKKMLAEAWSRLASPLFNFTLVLLAMHAVIGGGFSRTGYAGRIAAAAAAGVVIRVLGFGAQAAADATPVLNILQFIVPLAPAIWAGQRLFLRERGARRSVRSAPVMAGAPA